MGHFESEERLGTAYTICSLLKFSGHPVLHPDELHLFRLLASPDALDILKHFEGSLTAENSHSGLIPGGGWPVCTTLQLARKQLTVTAELSHIPSDLQIHLLSSLNLISIACK